MAGHPGGGGRWFDDRPGRRLFFAVPVPEGPRAEMEALVERLRGPRPEGRAGNPRLTRDVRWVRLDGLHVTIRFLGPTEEDQLPGLLTALEAAAAATAPFGIRVSGGGAFPTPDHPRTLWLRIGQGEEELAALARRLDAALVPHGWEPDPRPFRGHLTLARTDGVPSGAAMARRLIEAAGSLRLDWTADRLVLFESITGQGPARYVPVGEAPFRA